MIHMMRKTLKKIQTVYVKDLLYGLMERNMGTAEVINHADRIFKTGHTNTGKRPTRTTAALETERVVTNSRRRQ